MTKEEHIARMVKDTHGRFAIVFTGVCKTLARVNSVRIPSDTLLGIAIQVRYMQADRGGAEYLDAYHADAYWYHRRHRDGKLPPSMRFDVPQLLSIKPGTIQANVRTYLELKGRS
jgi:hypothetical protein